ncbi:MAG: (d)CMP kinase [Actinomycetota bacterium]|nr:(d)CMP kinase [Actinomycetota bacterium]
MTGAGAPARRGPLVAIDGPAGSGKTTVSRALAERLAVDRLDTGAMYRAVTWLALARGVDLTDGPALGLLARRGCLEVGERVVADGTDVTAAIRSPEVSASVSLVAAHPEVRAVLVERQRRWVSERSGAVVEGRDIGSVVLPDADVKVYLDAAPEERARRRADERAAGVARRDELDRGRAASPLAVAEGARVIDTTGRAVGDIVEEIVGWLTTTR